MRLLILLGLCLPNLALALVLRPGDVILQPLRCYSCTLIEAQEKSDFSHMGLVVDEGHVAEALGVVRIVTLEEFLKKGDPTRAHKIMRPREQVQFKLREALAPILGAEFDRAYRWDNLGRDGREAYYCSEMVTKILNQFLRTKMPPKAMDFSQNYEGWSRYFNGDVPQGELGISPADYERSSLFEQIGTYQGGQWN